MAKLTIQHKKKCFQFDVLAKHHHTWRVPFSARTSPAVPKPSCRCNLASVVVILPGWASSLSPISTHQMQLVFFILAQPTVAPQLIQISI